MSPVAAPEASPKQAHTGTRGMQTVRTLMDFAASADPQLLDKANWAERHRLKSLGLMVLVIAGVNLLAGFGALQLILQPSRASSTAGVVWGYVVCALVAAAWALIVLNLYRFFASAVHQADASGPFRWGVLLRALPKTMTALLLAGLLGASAALPVTVWVVRADIKGQLTATQLRVASAFQEGVARRFDAELERLYADQVADASEEERLRDLIKSAQTARRAMDLSGNRKGTPAEPSVTDNTVEHLKAAASLRENISRRSARIEDLRLEMDAAKRAALQQVETSDSLFTEAYRVIEHGAGVYWAVALFMAILHSGPLLIRLLSPRGPYEHLVDIQNEVVLAKHGVLRNASILHDEDSREYRVDRYLVAEGIARHAVKKQAEERSRTLEQLRHVANQKLSRIRTNLPGETGPS